MNLLRLLLIIIINLLRHDWRVLLIALARVFVTFPKILFADEPTGNLDAATGAQIIAMMLELDRAHGTTLILVSHDESLAQRCNRQLHLAAGQVM